MGAGTSNSYGTSIEPLLFIVVSVSDQSTAEVIISTRDWSSWRDSVGKRWLYLSGSLNGRNLEVTPNLSIIKPRYEFRWSDDGSGRYTDLTGGLVTVYSAPFTRLDG